MKRVIENELVRFILVGAFNTLIGYGVFYILFTYFQLTPYISNAFGYIAALIVAFGLSKQFVFRSTYQKGMVTKFIVAFLISFALNQFVLLLMIEYSQLAPEIAQILAMASYTLIFYLLNKYFVFSR
ncbi:GtrA family protein [Pseudidiomarina sp.]|uniref:GtrA family protein n=1 Tax=Pseudidiomarina sp. TaxID=2081707 RepID=UPI003A980AAD